MAAFLIVHRREISDPETLKKYRDGVGQSIARFGGNVVVRSDAFEVLEGDWEPGRHGDDSEPERLVIIEFPDMATLKSWYNSEDYAKLKAIRQASSTSDVAAVEGASVAAR